MRIGLGLGLSLASVSVAPLQATRSPTSGAPGDTVTVTPTGGVAPYSYAAAPGGNNSGGSFASNVWTIGNTGSVTDTLRVTDSVGSHVDVTVTVTAAVAISPSSQTVESGLTQTFTASGGKTPYTYSISTNNTGGSINSSTGVYTCGPTTGAGNDTVRVTDANGKTSSATVTPSWTPRALSGVLSWHRADQGVTIATGVSQWNDLGGSGDTNRNAAQATGGNQPSAPATNSKLNNQLSITFASSQRLVTGTYSTPPAAPLTLIAVFSDGATGKVVLDSLSGDSQACIVQYNNSIGFKLGGTSFLSGSAYDTNGHLFVGQLNGASSSERKDNMTTPDVSGTTTFAATGFTFGDDRAGGANAGVKIAEIAIVNGTLSSGDKASLRSYAQTRYGLTIGA